MPQSSVMCRVFFSTVFPARQVRLRARSQTFSCYLGCTPVAGRLWNSAAVYCFQFHVYVGRCAEWHDACFSYIPRPSRFSGRCGLIRLLVCSSYCAVNMRTHGRLTFSPVNYAVYSVHRWQRNLFEDKEGAKSSPFPIHAQQRVA